MPALNARIDAPEESIRQSFVSLLAPVPLVTAMLNQAKPTMSLFSGRLAKKSWIQAALCPPDSVAPISPRKIGLWLSARSSLSVLPNVVENVGDFVPSR